MDASEIQAFLTLAGELHFTRTADRLWLSQSRVSRLIASLERRVGGPLFERTSRQVRPAEADSELRGLRVLPALSQRGGEFVPVLRADEGGATCRVLRVIPDLGSPAEGIGHALVFTLHGHSGNSAGVGGQ